MTILIEVPPGLNGVAVTDTAIGDVDGEAGYYHYRGHDATALARACSFEDVWHLVAVGHLPDAAEAAALPRTRWRRRGACPSRCCPCSSRWHRPAAPRSAGSGPPSRSPPTSSACAR